MSVSNISSSFSSIYKAGGEMLQQVSLPLMGMAVGVGLGMTTCCIEEIQRINSEALSYNIKANISQRITAARNSWLVAGVLAFAGLVWPNRNFALLTAVSSAVSFVFLRGINVELARNYNNRDLNLSIKLQAGVNRAFLTLIPTAVVSTMFLVSAYVQAEQKV